MSDTPQRRLHTVTIAVMVLVAGVFCALNFGPWLTYLAWVAVALDGLPILLGIASSQIMIVLILGAICEFAIRRYGARKP